MKKLFSAMLFLVPALCLRAVVPDPYNLYVNFSFRTTGAPYAGGTGVMTVYGESTQAMGAALAQGSNVIESALGSVPLRPGKTYTVNFMTYGCSPSRFDMSFMAPDGYAIYINNSPIDLLSQNVPNIWQPCSYNYTVKVVPVARSLGAPAGILTGFEIGKSVTWEVGLGNLRTGQGAGMILFKEFDLVTNAPASRARLYYSAPANYYQITSVYDASNYLRQVMAPQTLVDLVDDTSGYWIKFYLPTEGTWNGSTYTINPGATPWRTIRVVSPGTSQLTITETEGSAVRVSALALTSGSVASGNYVWTLQDGDGSTWLRTTTHTSTVNGDSSRDDVVAVRTGGTGGVMVAKIKFHYVNQGWGEEVTQVVADPDSSALATNYTYFTNAANKGNYRRVQSVTGPTGNWSSFLYYDVWDRRGQLQVESHPYVSTPGTQQGASTSIGNSTAYDYQADYSGRYRAEISRGTYTTNIQSAQRLTTPTLGQVLNSKSYTRYQANDYGSASSSQQTTAEIYDPSGSDPDYFLQPLSVKRPDQSQDSYAYSPGNFDTGTKVFTVSPSGSCWRTNVWHGSTNSSGAYQFTQYAGVTVPTIYLLPNKSTMDVVIRNAAGLVLHTETWVHTGSGNFTPINSGDSTYDGAGRLTQTTISNGTTTTVVYNAYTNGRLASSVDIAGTEADFTYDVLGRVATRVKKGAPSRAAMLTAGYSYQSQSDITTTYTYDGANNVTQEVVSSGSLPLTTTRQFDLAGRQTQQVDPGYPSNFTTGYAYSSGGLITTVTLPGGATKVVQNYLDGQLQQISGTGVISQNVGYWVDGGTGNKARQVVVGGVWSAWTNIYNDWLGRTVQEWRPEWDGNAWARTWTYNTNGQLFKFTQPGVAATLYGYDTMGGLYQECLDVNGNNTIDTASTDRIKQHVWSIITGDGGASWSRQTTNSTYATAGSGTATTTDFTNERLSGFSAGMVSQQYTYDIYLNGTIYCTLVNPANKTLTSYVVAPDSTISAAQVAYNGLGVEAEDTTGVIMRYEYDALGRKIHDIDPRTGMTTTAYCSGSSLVNTVTDPAAIAQATYTYDSAGRVATFTNGLNKIARYDYDALNHKIHEYGATPYPVQYGYDSCGRLTSQSTYREGSGWNGTSWPSSTTGTADTTTWNIHQATGLLQSKTDPSNHSVSFTYDAARRMYTRTWARGVVATFGYDSNTAELTSVTYSNDPAQTPSLSYTYNRLGQRATAGDAAGTRTFTYNLSQTFELQNEDFGGYYGTGRRLTYFYDTTNPGTKGRPTGLGVGTGGNPTADQGVTYGYDGYGRFNGLTGGMGGTTQTFAYGYTGNSHLIYSVTDSAANYSDTRTYDTYHDWVASRTTTNTVTGNGATFTYTPDNLGRTHYLSKQGTIFSTYDTSGLKITYGYNDRNELNSELTQTLSDLTTLQPRNDSYSYDSIGNRTSVTHNGVASNYYPTQLNQYDHRVVDGSFDVAGSAPAGDTITVTSPGGPTDTAWRKASYFFDAYPLANTQTPAYATLTIKDNGNPVATLPAFVAQTPESFGYDLDGNLTSDGRWNCTYDGENRLIAMETNSAAVNAGVPRQLVSFGYDYANRRIWKKVQSGWNGSAYTSTDLWRRFIYDGWNLIAETDHTNSDAILRNYFWGLDLSGSVQGAGGVGGLLMVQDGGGGSSYLPVYDAVGNVYGLLKASDGSLAACYEYDAFGRVLRESGTYAATNPFQFSTKYTDIETGLNYYGLRYYNPSLGRFINRDPSEEQGGLGLYSFCLNNSVNSWDCLGLTTREEERAAYGPYQAEWEARYKDAGLAFMMFGQWVEKGGLASPTPSWVEGIISQMRGLMGGGSAADALMYCGDPTADPYAVMAHYQGIADKQARQAARQARAQQQVENLVASLLGSMSDRVARMTAAITDTIVGAASGALWAGDMITLGYGPNTGLASSGGDFWAQRTRAGNVTQITSLSDIENPHARNILNYLANDKEANALAQSARSGTGFASMNDRINDRLIEQGTIQLMTIVNGNPAFHLYPDIITSGTGEGYKANFNSLLLGPAEMRGIANSLKVTGPYFALAYHDHGGTGPMSQDDANWASRWGAVAATNRNTAYIAVGLTRNPAGQPIVQLYEGPLGILGLK